MANNGVAEHGRPFRAIAVGPGAIARGHFAILRACAFILRMVAKGRGCGRVAQLMSPLQGLSRGYCDLEAKGIALRVSLDDHYWLRYVLKGSDYEPEVGAVLRRYVNEDVAFIDCGANVGLWANYFSKMASKATVVAVEPASGMFRRLEETTLNNASSVRLIPSALWNEAGVQLEMEEAGSSHARARVAPLHKGRRIRQHSRVSTVTLDSMCRDHNLFSREVIIVKLDVEGAEVRALLGAQSLRGHRSVIIYEDHASDRSCAPSRVFLEDWKWAVFAIGATGQAVRCADVPAVLQMKGGRSAGYNFVACPAESVDASFLAGLEYGGDGAGRGGAGS